jgi:hypothetical protein
MFNGNNGGIILKESGDRESNLSQLSLDSETNILYCLITRKRVNYIAALQIPPKWQ